MSKKTILVVGGAGFIGSQVNQQLHQAKYETVVLDNLSRGHKGNVQRGHFFEGDMANSFLLDKIFSEYSIDAVMHFAGLLNVGESFKDPLRYYHQNVANTIQLIEAMTRHRINNFIFSSSAAVYGIPVENQISENHPLNPISPYGRSKLMIEQILKDCSDIRFCSLRYFNAAGGDPDGKLKNHTKFEFNLIPVILRCIKENRTVTINGNDYPTPDGTCIRDYIHVYDLASAHISAMEKLFLNGKSEHYNLGNGQGFSNLEVLNAIENITGQKVSRMFGPKRPGDPAVLVADAQKAYSELGWQPKYASLETIVAHAWQACV